MEARPYTYCVTWSAENNEDAGLCAEFQSLCWLARTPETELAGIRKAVRPAVNEVEAEG
jgi:hypothetical protein